MNQIGIMQGRLLPHEIFEPQLFPWAEWKKEFLQLSINNVKKIEWMFNYDNYQNNPLFDTEVIIDLCRKYNAEVSSVCMNFFMCQNILQTSVDDIMEKIIQCAIKLGAKLIVIPLFEKSIVNGQIELKKVCDWLTGINDRQGNLVKFALETELDVLDLSGVLKDYENIGICYDIGNATGFGYNTVQELVEGFEKELIYEIHIKDKDSNCSTVLLGTGEAKIEECIGVAKDYHYKGNFILESYYRGLNSIQDTVDNINYIKKILY